MSCDNNRQKFFSLLENKPASIQGAADLERVWQAAKARAENESALAGQPERSKTRQLFAAIEAAGLKPPTHSKDGLPRGDAAVLAYAAVYDRLETQWPNDGIAGLTKKLADTKGAGAYSPEGWDAQGFDREGYNRQGLDRAGYDRDGYNRRGYDRKGYDRDGYNQDGFDAEGYDRKGYNKFGLDREGRDIGGFDQHGFDAEGYDVLGFDRNGLNRNGFNRQGYDAEGYDESGLDKNLRDRKGNYPAKWKPNKNGMFPDGYEVNYLGKDGYNPFGYDLGGYERDGYDPLGFDRNGYNMYGCRYDNASRTARTDPDAKGRSYYNTGFSGDTSVFNLNTYPDTYKLVSEAPPGAGPTTKYTPHLTQALSGVNRDGYNALGLNLEQGGYSFTGYDAKGLDKNGKPRIRTVTRDGKEIPWTYKLGKDSKGYTPQGYHYKTGLTDPEADPAGQGLQYNPLGFVYDPQNKTFYNPNDPDELMDFVWAWQGKGKAHEYQGIIIQAAVRRKDTPPIKPFEPRPSGAHIPSPTYYDFSSSGSDAPGSGMPVPLLDDKGRTSLIFERMQAYGAESGQGLGVAWNPETGALNYCPHCKRKQEAYSHNCRKFGKEVTVFQGGVVVHGYSRYRRGSGWSRRRGSKGVPNQELPPALVEKPYGFESYLEVPGKAFDHNYPYGGYNLQGFDSQGLDARGLDTDGFDAQGLKEGYDRTGRDREGYDKLGFNREGVDRHGFERPRTLNFVADQLDREDKLLDNGYLARLYSNIATSMAGKPRRVYLRPGGGFSTDMRGSIYADPYPLGENAPPQHNLTVTRAGIYHEIGHEMETTPQVWFEAVGRAQQVQDEMAVRSMQGSFRDDIEGEVEIEIDGRTVRFNPKDIEGSFRAPADVADLSPGARMLLPQYLNIVEDGRMERKISRDRAGVASVLAASCTLEPRWDKRVGNDVPVEHQVTGALLYAALPFYAVDSKTLAAMSPDARRIYEELKPTLGRAMGPGATTADAYQAAVTIVRKLDQEGLVAQPSPPDENGQGTNWQSFGASATGGVQISMPASILKDIPPNATLTASPGSQSSQQQGSAGNQGQPSNGRQQEAQGHSGGSGQPQEGPDGQKQGSGGSQAGQEGQNGDQEGTGNPGDGTETQDGQEKDGQGSGGEDQEEKNARRRKGRTEKGSEQPEKLPGETGQSSSQPGETSQGTGSGEGQATEVGFAGDWEDEFSPIGRNDLSDVLGSVDQEAAAAIRHGLKSKNSPKSISDQLARPLTGAKTRQRYIDSNGEVTHAEVLIPSVSDADLLQRLEQRSPTIRQNARQVASILERVRDLASQRVLKRQTRGRMDRSQIRRAYTGREDVLKRKERTDETSLAASLVMDLSGSMAEHVSSGAIYDSMMTMAEAFNILDVPYEVRAFGSRGSDTHLKAMDETAFLPTRAAFVASTNLGSTEGKVSCTLSGQTLAGREEKNRLQVVLTDGMFGDHESVVAALEETRGNGVVTFGLYLGEAGPHVAPMLDALYQPGNWAAISSLDEIPSRVARRIEVLFNHIR